MSVVLLLLLRASLRVDEGRTSRLCNTVLVPVPTVNRYEYRIRTGTVRNRENSGIFFPCREKKKEKGKRIKNKEM